MSERWEPFMIIVAVLALWGWIGAVIGLLNISRLWKRVSELESSKDKKS